MQERPFSATVGERRIIHLHARDNHVAHEPQRAIAHECAGQKTGFAQDLEAIACAQHEFTRARVADHCFHHRRKASDSAAPKIIAIRKTARQHDGIKVVKRRFLVPHVLGM